MPSIARKITQFSKKEIDYLFKNARRALKSSDFLILSAPRQLDFGRVLIVASRKVGNAPERNKIRRRIKSLFYEEQFFNGPFDWVVIVYRNAVNMPFDQLKNVFCKVYKQTLAK